MVRTYENDPNGSGTTGGWGWLLGFAWTPLVAWIVHSTSTKEKEKLKEEHQQEIRQVKEENDAIRENFTKLQQKNSVLQEEVKKQMDNLTKLQKENSLQREKGKKEMDHLNEENDAIRENLSKLQEENSLLRKKPTNQYLLKLEYENQMLKQHNKQQQGQIDQHDEWIRTMGIQGIVAKEVYLGRLAKQLHRRQDIKCSPWRPRSLREDLEEQILDEAETNVHAITLDVPAGLREIFEKDNHCGHAAGYNGKLMWEFWRKWKEEVDKYKHIMRASDEKSSQAAG